MNNTQQKNGFKTCVSAVGKSLKKFFITIGNAVKKIYGNKKICNRF